MSERPNVLVVLCDQMRRQAMGCSGDPNVSTPTIDGLAADGVRFENACSTYPICVPTRFTFLTGEYAHTRHAQHYWRMSPAEETFAHELNDAGFRTGYVGKWHLADTLDQRPVPEALQGGFQHWQGFEVRNDHFDSHYYENDDPTRYDVEGFQTDGLFDLADGYVTEHASDDDPFCLVLSVEPPHPPFEAPEAYLERYADRTLELRPNVPFGDDGALPEPHSSWGDRQSASEELFERQEYRGETTLDELRAYYAMIENLDDNLGQLLQRLETEGIREETAVVFLSDHGEMAGSHGLHAKQHPYEESVGIPFVVSYPDGGIDDGRVVSTPTCTEDWYPTILGLAGIETPDTPGVDLTPLATDERESLDRPGVLLEFYREQRPGMPYSDETWRGFRTRRYKYTVKGDRLEGGEPWQLFDLESDPYERENLVGDSDYTATARRLHGHLRDALERSGDDYGLEPAFGHEPYPRTL
jgi:arylsulfatase A-like enzyme